MSIDVNAARAARREAKKVQPTIAIDKKTYKLPVEMPFEVVEKMSRLGEEENSNTLLLEIFEGLLNGQFEAFMKHKPSIQDLTTIMAALPGEYGFGGLGESEPSEV